MRREGDAMDALNDNAIKVIMQRFEGVVTDLEHAVRTRTLAPSPFRTR